MQRLTRFTKSLTTSAQATLQLFKAAFSDWTEDNASRLAAALAFYATISLAPLLLIVVSISGLAFGQKAVTGELLRQMRGVLGPESAQLIQDIIASAYNPKKGISSTVLGTIILLFGATGVFGSLQDGLNAVWEITPKPGRGVVDFIRDRLLSLTMVLGVGFLLLVSLFISAALSALANYFGGILRIAPFALQAADFVVSFGVVTLLFGLIYKVLPDVEIVWKDVWIGAFLTSLLFTIGKYAIGAYLGRSSVGTAYGAAGSLVVILLWIYYSAEIVFFGAELTQVYVNRFGSRIRPISDELPD